MKDSDRLYRVRVKEIIFTDYLVTAVNAQEAQDFFGNVQALETASLESYVSQVTDVETGEVVYTD